LPPRLQGTKEHQDTVFLRVSVAFKVSPPDLRGYFHGIPGKSRLFSFAWVIKFWLFEFVSNFDIRILDLLALS
jgi:hypothetical protein